MAYSYKSAIAFGLIYIPITLNLVIRDNDIHFNLLDKKTKSRVKYKKTCVDCNDVEIRQKDIVKGFQYEENKYVIFDKDDFEKLQSKRDKSITIEQFIDINEIDPIYYDKSYYVVPTGAEKAFKLLLLAMEEEGKVGIAKVILRNKETLIAIRVRNGQMLLNTLFFHEEVQVNPTKDIQIKVKNEELNLAKTLIKSMSAPLKIENYKDEYRQKIQDAIESKIVGREIISPKEDKQYNIANIMDALQQSLKMQQRPRV